MCCGQYTKDFGFSYSYNTGDPESFRHFKVAEIIHQAFLDDYGDYPKGWNGCYTDREDQVYSVLCKECLDKIYPMFNFDANVYAIQYGDTGWVYSVDQTERNGCWFLGDENNRHPVFFETEESARKVLAQIETANPKQPQAGYFMYHFNDSLVIRKINILNGCWQGCCRIPGFDSLPWYLKKNYTAGITPGCFRDIIGNETEIFAKLKAFKPAKFPITYP